MDDEATFHPELRSPDFIADPYPTYRRMREEVPVLETTDGDWFVTRYHDVATILSDPRFRRQSPGYANPFSYARRDSVLFERMVGQWMVFVDPPLHMRLRRPSRGRFIPPNVESLRPLIRDVVGRLLDDAVERGTLEVMEDFAYPLPIIVVSRILGVPAEDYGVFRDAMPPMTRALDLGTEAEMNAAEAVARRLGDYFHDLVAARRSAPAEDLISDLIQAETEDGPLDDEMIVANAVFMLWAGHETTKNLIGNGLLALLRAPSQLAALRNDPQIGPWAVEEMLRYDAPVQKLCRWTTEPVTLSGRTIPADRLVVAVLGSANRDPRKFEDPDRFDVTRPPGAHMSFGRGRHHCLGAALAPVEAQEAICELLRRFPALDYDPHGIDWQDTTSIRGLRRFPVQFTPRDGADAPPAPC